MKQELRIEFDFNKEDLYYFNIFATERNSLYKREVAVFKIIFIILLMMVGIVYGTGLFFDMLIKDYSVYSAALVAFLWIALFTILAIITWFYFLPKLFRLHMNRRVRKFIKDYNDPLIGRHTMSFNHKSISDSCDVAQESIKWNAIEKIEETEKHFFLMLSEIRAYIIPKKVFSDENQLEEFKETIKKYHQSAIQT